MDYNSTSLDGRTSAENGQASWIGDGWDYSPGFIERSYKACAKDGKANSGDRCWAGQDVVNLSLGGSSNALVRDGSSSTWRLADDDGSTVELLAGADNGDGGGNSGPGQAGEFWKITTTDGTALYFGRNHLPGGDGTDPATGSAWTMPVFGNDAGEPCNQPGSTDSAFNASSCQQAWRWNLDYVVDPHGNLTTYTYTPESNAYARGLNSVTSNYTRGGVLKTISYGQQLSEQVAAHGSLNPAATISFTVDNRCLQGTACLDQYNRPTNGSNWDDTPIDQACYGTAACSTHSPTFWSTKRLTGISTAVLVGSAYRTVDTYALAQTLPRPNDGSNATLWLQSVTRTGVNGGSKNLPAVTFGATPLANRVDGSSPAQSSFLRSRLSSIRTETGGVITVVYSLSPKAISDDADACSRLHNHMPSAADTNTLTCFPVWWIPGDTQPDWFNKYLVKSVTEADDTSLSSLTPNKVTTYEYQGGAAWHRDDSQLTENAQRTWDQYRGYSTVITRTGEAPAVITQSATTYYRGMDQNLNSANTATSASVSDSTGGSDVDDNWLAGQIREQATYTQSGGTIATTTITDPWASAVTATRFRSGLPALKARMTGVQTVNVRERTAAGTWRVSRRDYTYDSNGQVSTVDDRGDGSTTTPRRCTTTTYASAPPGSNMVNYPSQIVVFKGACTGTPNVNNTVTGLRTLYDGSTSVGNGLTEGDATTAQSLDRYSGGAAVYVTVSTATYDVYGRTLSSTDGMNATSTTTYTPLTGALPTSIQAKNPLNWATTTSFDPARSQPLTTTDVNGRVTATAYDPLGRLTGVWLPGRSKATQSANVTYTYSVPGGAYPRVPVSVTTNTLLEDGSTYSPNIKIYDGLMRQRQEQSDPENNDPGRVISDTFYDTHGWVVKTSNPRFNKTVDAPSTSYWVTPDDQIPGQVGTFYDGMGRVTSSRYVSEAIEQWRTTTAYPGLDRIDVTPPNGASATTTLTDSRGHTTGIWTYDTATPTGVATDAKITTYGYDAGDHLTAITDPAGNLWTYGFDTRGRQTSASDPDAGVSSSTYDNNDRVTTATNPSGTLATSYDTLGRRTGTYVNDTSGTRLSSWSYDGITGAKGYLNSSSRYDGANEYKNTIAGYTTRYQPTGSTITVPDSEGALAGDYDMTTLYTPNLEYLRRNTYPAKGGLPAETIYYTHGAKGPLTSAGGLDYYQSDIHVTPFGEVDRITLGPNPSQAQTTYVYDEGSRRLLSSHLDKQVGVEAVDDRRYTYNPAGDVTSVTTVRDTAGVTDRQCYTYDGQHRLKEAWTDTAGVTTAAAPKFIGLGGCTDTTPSTGSGGSVGGPSPYWLTWGFDAVGNRTTQVDHSTTTTGGTSTTYTHPSAGTVQPHSVTATNSTGMAPGSATYGYNTSGQLTSRPGTGGGSQTLTYTPDGHLDTLSQSGGTAPGTTSYVYDADGNQLLRRSPGHTTLYLGYEDLDLATTGAGAGTITANRYYPGSGSTIVRTKVSTATGNGTLAYQFATDGHNSNTVTLAAGTLTTSRRDLTPYGTPRGTPPINWAGTKGFVGGTTDSATALTLLGARNYDPSLGVFTTPDPLIVPTSPGSLTAYGYANNNPVSNSDPTGLLTDDGWGSGGSGPAREHNNSRSQGNEASTGHTAAQPSRALTGPEVEPAHKRQGSPPPTDVYSHPDALLKAFSCQGTICAYTYPEYVPGYDQQQLANQEAVQMASALTGFTDGKECFVHGEASGCVWTVVAVFPFGKFFKGLRAAEEASEVARAANGATNAANGVRLGQQLARESAESAFTSSGRLSSGAIADSSEIISGSRLGNKDLIARLTSDGSDIADWGKYTTRTHQSPSGDFQVHFYMNRSTGVIDYGHDYKVVFNGAR